MKALLTFTRNDGTFLRTYRFTWRGIVLDQVKVLDAENAARVCRRTMQPYAAVTLTHDERPESFGHGALECISFPFVEGNVAQVMLRKVGDDGGDLLQVPCLSVRPIKFSPKRTGIPVNDPIARRSA